VLRRTFGTKREEVAGGWGTLHNEEPHNFYHLPYIISIRDGSVSIGIVLGAG
jgi:hypothetical protein